MPLPVKLEKVCMAENSLFMILNSTMEEDFLYPPETDDTGEFMDEYYGENLYEADLSYGELYDDEFMYECIPFLELADNCVLVSLLQTIVAVLPLLALCFASRLLHIISYDSKTFLVSAFRNKTHIYFIYEKAWLSWMKV